MTRSQIAVVLALVGGCDASDSPKPQAAETLSPDSHVTVVAVPAQAPNNEPPPAAPPSPQPEVTSLSVASFKRDNLTDCTTVTVGVTAVGEWEKPYRLTGEQMTVVSMDDALVAMRGGKGALLSDDSGDSVTMMRAYALMLDGLSDQMKSEDKFVQSISSLTSWPTPNFKKAAKTGAVMRMNTCDVPNRTALAECVVKRETNSEDVKALANVTHVSLRVERRHFSVADTLDSDAAMKRCLMLGGEWSAASQADGDIAHERLRQHVGQLNQLVQQFGQASRSE